jgi:FK506-binding nuclear protein
MVDDKKTGTGPAAKKGDKVNMRYIGKLKDGKMFNDMSSFTKGPR